MCGKTAPLQVVNGRVLRYLMFENNWAVADAVGNATSQTTTTEGEHHHDLPALAGDAAGTVRAHRAPHRPA